MLHSDVLYLTLAARTVLIAFVAVFGLCMGSFIYCEALRAAGGRGARSRRSRCPLCGHVLGAVELIPVVSYILQRGRCRSCNGKISIRYPLSEIVCAVMYVACVLRFGLGLETLRAVVFASFLFCCAVTDLEHGIVLDRFHVAAVVIWIATLPAAALERDGKFYISLWELALVGLAGGVGIALPVLVVAMCMKHAMKRACMGAGDIKMLFVVGLYLGVEASLLSLIASCVIGIVAGLVYIRRDGDCRTEGFPFAPAIAVSAFVVMLVKDFFPHYLPV